MSVGKLPAVPVQGQKAGVAPFAKAGDHGRLAAQRQQLFQHGAHLLPGPLLLPGRAGQQGGLGEIGQNQVRAGADLRHGLGEVRPKAGIKPPLIRHGRVRHHDVFSGAEILDEVHRLLALLLIGQVPGVDGVETQAQRLPVAADGLHLAGNIQAGITGKHGMGGQNCRGQNGALHPHGGEDGQGNGDAAPAEAGNVLQGDNAFHMGLLSRS